jgi:hypothetical protein
MTFRDFWPLYLQAHSRPSTRAVHYGATVVGVGSALAAAVMLQPLFLLGIGVAYAFAIGAHAFIENNRSMVRVNPAWGALADLRMFWLAATGGLRREIARCDPERSRGTANRAAGVRAISRWSLSPGRDGSARAGSPARSSSPASGTHRNS